MSRSDGLPSQRTTGLRKDTSNSLKLPHAMERDTEANISDRPDDYDDASDAPTRSSTSIVRRNLYPQRTSTSPSSPIPPRRTSSGQPVQSSSAFTNPNANPPYPRSTTRQVPQFSKAPAKGKVHWLLPAGIGMIAMLVLWELGTLVLSWGLARYDDFRYGNPRTFQTNAVVGHGDSPQHPSHFIAINLNRQAIVVEFPAGNPAGAESYVVPYYILGQGGDLTPITLEFRDVTGDHKLDMIIHIHLQTQDQTFVFVNDGTKFRAPTSKDNIHL